MLSKGHSSGFVHRLLEEVGVPLRPRGRQPGADPAAARCSIQVVPSHRGTPPHLSRAGLLTRPRLRRHRSPRLRFFRLRHIQRLCGCLHSRLGRYYRPEGHETRTR
ncbi:helix-turn-helix domain-containing protein [Nonomuraea fuscirosea]|uniref:helix-turn-helix domain-containing protein n=1 Tax=Nonomuraea fuscirosea TaxID=1291556 RepID=UPI003CCBDC7B